MLLDLVVLVGVAWELGCNPLPGSGGAATLPELFISASHSAKQDVKGV